ncbi:MAG: glycosyltransferase family 39 protein [Chloroflexota bacterium]
MSKQAKLKITQTLGILVASALLFTNLGEASYWLDEIFSVINVADYASVQFALEQSGGNRLFYYLVLWPWTALFGDHEFVARLQTGLTCILALCLLYALSKKFFGTKAALFATFLLVANPFFIAYGRLARNYGLLVLLAIASFFCLLSYLKSGQRKFLYLYTVINILMVLTHPVTAPFLLSQAIAILIFWNWKDISWGALFVSFSLAGLCYLAMPLVFGSPDSGQAEWLRPPDAAAVVQTLGGILGGHTGMILFALLVFGFLLFEGMRNLRTGTQNENFRLSAFFAANFWLPVVLLIIVSYTIQPAFLDRYLIVILPAFVISAGYVLSKINNFGILVVACIFPLVALVSLNFGHTPATQGWREAADLIYSEYDEGDTVGFFVYYGHRPFNYYLERKLNGKEAEEFHFTELADGPYFLNGGSRQPAHNAEAIQNLSLDHERLWFVVFGIDLFQEETINQEVAIRQDLEANYGTEMSISNFGLVTVYLYDLN